jgi:tetratricopeptide (TPR) repeat protein
MSRKLNLADRLLAMGRTMQQLGRTSDARQILGRLSQLAELPAPLAEETQARLAELYLKDHSYRPARRHLAVALTLRPDSARYHYLLANALDNDLQGNSRRAANHYRRSLELDPNQPRCLGEFGLLALRLGQTEEGLEALHGAVRLAPDDPEAIGNLVEGLRREGLAAEARQVLRAALFRNPRNGRIRRIQQDFEFHQLRQQQETARNHAARGGPADDGPVLLPFEHPAGDGSASGPGNPIRHDNASLPAAPFFLRRDRRSDRKRAQ